MTVRSLADVIRSCDIQHPRAVHIRSELCRRIDEALAGGQPRVSWVVGPSRCGQSQLLSTLMKRYPPGTTAGKRTQPLVVAEVPSSATEQMLPDTTLKALGVSFAESTTAKLTQKMRVHLTLAQSRAIALDEASHLVDHGARVMPYAAAEWLKQTATPDLRGGFAGMSLILTGVPRLERMFRANPQLVGRSYSRIEFRPYDVSDKAERLTFLTAVNTFMETFKKEGWPFKDSLKVVGDNCYLQCPGLIGGLSEFMQELTKALDGSRPREVTFDDLARTARKLASLGDPQYPAFVGPDVSLAAMNQAFQYVLNVHGMQ